VSQIQTLATHLPRWGTPERRIAGPDQDAVTLAVDAGRGALNGSDATPQSVVFVSRDLQQLSGGHEAVLLAGLDLPASTSCTTVLGGAPIALLSLADAAPGVLVIAVDVVPVAAAAAALTGDTGLELTRTAVVTRSLPIRVRTDAGKVYDYDDPRLQRDIGTKVSLRDLGLSASPVAVAGIGVKDSSAITGHRSAPLPSSGPAAALFCLADAATRGVNGGMVAFEDASAAAAMIGSGTARVTRYAPEPAPLPLRKAPAAADIKISLPAYERAFDSRIGLRAGCCSNCGQLDLPPRRRCLACGSEAGSTLVALPRDGVVYTCVDVHVPVPGITTPYSLAVVELGDTGVRLLAPVTDQGSEPVSIGDAGHLVLRRLSTRVGVPDYGYAFAPGLAQTSSDSVVEVPA
jgi:uncharacterized OB-fold protein